MNNSCITGMTGVSDSRSAYIISKYIEQKKGQKLIVTATEKRARALADDLYFFTDKMPRVLPQEDQLLLNFEAKSNDALMKRLSVLQALRTDPDCIVVAPVSAAVKRMIPRELFIEKTLRLEYGKEADTDEIREMLTELGYERMPMVEEHGQFSIRGGILDVFPPDADDPFRVEFFGPEIDSVRSFDIDTQRSIENLKYIEIGPASQLPLGKDSFDKASQKIKKEYGKQISKLEKLAAKKSEAEKDDLSGPDAGEAAQNLKKRMESLCDFLDSAFNIQLLENYVHYFTDEIVRFWDYMPAADVFVDDPDRVLSALEERGKEQKADFELMLARGLLIPKDKALVTGKEILTDLFRAASGEDDKDDRKESPWKDRGGNRELIVLMPFAKRISGIEAYKALENCDSRQIAAFGSHMDMLSHDIRGYIDKGYKITLSAGSDERLKSLEGFLKDEELSEKVSLVKGVLTSGFEIPREKICFISENDIFGGFRERAGRRRKKRGGARLESFTDLKKGDLVVHEAHGIGRFLGIEALKIQGEKKDYLKIKYAGSDLLYVPVEQFDIVQKYIGAEGKPPKINKLSGVEWKAAKAKARAAVQEMAKELIELYAKREAEPGFAFDKDTVWQAEFEDDFPYEETGDQLRAVEEIKADMEKPVPMDRLLLGDVGFGKTEVAARAMFKAVTDSKQVAMLVPTTLLANQHYHTLKERFERFPVRVEMLSRFRSDKEQTKIVKALGRGEIDVLIGTHRILSDDVRFKDLGLLVVDEEQRFGVAHKEKIKKLKKNVDVLTLSATPIPRTLNMSLTGIKDMSVIEEPPEDRYPVRTYVTEQDDLVIRDAIVREIDRGGQAFVVFNRVRGISAVAEKIRKLVPEARVAVGHGQMSEQNLENVMMDFMNGEYDVLVATTIIESGIDIQNANTLIVMDADRYGLAQLYQIRGRVGRSGRIAYAYLMYQKEKVLTEVAVKRLKAIREFTEFGSGFKVAMRDMQIRGAGNVLGSEQSGHMMDIGYELYCKIVNDEVRKLKGESVSTPAEDLKIDIAVSAGVPDSYISDEVTKIRIYKRIATINDDESFDDVYDELTDRFGDPPDETVELMKAAYVRNLAEELACEGASEKNGQIVISFGEVNPLTALSIVKVRDSFPRAFVHGGTKPYIRIKATPDKKFDDLLELLKILKGGANAVQ